MLISDNLADGWYWGVGGLVKGSAPAILPNTVETLKNTDVGHWLWLVISSVPIYAPSPGSSELLPWITWIAVLSLPVLLAGAIKQGQIKPVRDGQNGPNITISGDGNVFNADNSFNHVRGTDETSTWWSKLVGMIGDLIKKFLQ